MDEIVWLDEALRDLERIGSYIAEHNPKAAQNVIRRIVEAVSALRSVGIHKVVLM